MKLRIRELRKSRELTIENLAQLVGVSRATINNYERGVHEPNIETLIRFADYFNVTVDYLIGREKSTK